jgi:hypothetical protein
MNCANARTTSKPPSRCSFTPPLDGFVRPLQHRRQADLAKMQQRPLHSSMPPNSSSCHSPCSPSPRSAAHIAAVRRGQRPLDAHRLRRADSVDLARHDLPRLPRRRPDLPMSERPHLGYADDPEMPMQVRIHLCRSKKRRLIWMLVLGVANGAATDLAASKQAHSRQHSQPASRHAELVVVASCPRRGRSGWR